MIDVRDMCFRYAHGSNQVLNNISLTVDAGEMLCLLGPSGGGKTTLVDTIMGVQVPQSGTVSVFGEQAPYRNARRRVGFMPQETALYEDISAQDNLRFFGELFGMHGNALLARMDELFALTDLRNDRGKLVADYSGGMKRRLSLAVALVQRPDLLVLDEAQRCERIAMIRRGSVIADGSPEEICRRTHAADLEEAFLTLERHRGEATQQKEERHA